MRQGSGKIYDPRGYCGTCLLIFAAMLLLVHLETAHAQVMPQQNGLTGNGTGVQTYENKNFDIRIQFTTQPDMPTMSNYTTLDFTVTHLDGTPVRNFMANLTEFTPSSNLTFTGSQYYKFSPINVTDGTFSAQYFFPSSGLYRILLSIAPNGTLVDAPFSVYVYNQSFQTANDFAIYGGIAAAGAAGGIIFYLKARKKP